MTYTIKITTFLFLVFSMNYCQIQAQSLTAPTTGACQTAVTYVSESCSVEYYFADYYGYTNPCVNVGDGWSFGGFHDGICLSISDWAGSISDYEPCYTGSVTTTDSDGDGVCDANEIGGCQDSYACNYESGATDNDGSCNYISCLDACGVINGNNSTCTDQCGVINGNNSTCADECTVPYGSGLYNYYIDNDSDGLGEGALITTCYDLNQQFCGMLSVSSGLYPAEVSWNIQNLSGVIMAASGAPYSQEVCLDLGPYTINMIDSYGDGWNGTNLSFNGSNFTFSDGSSSSSSIYITSSNSASLLYVTNGNDVCLNDPINDPDGDGVCNINEVFGCVETGACNFNLAATETDGTCEYTSCLDDCGLMNGDNSSCTGCTDSTALNFNLTASINDGSCIELVVGCTNPVASNYNPSANTCANDYNCDCNYNGYGCTDSLACNYDLSAISNIACIYEVPTNDSIGCSTLDITSIVTSDSTTPSGISQDDEVTFSVEIESSEWTVGSYDGSQCSDSYQITKGCNVQVWQSASPITYTITYSSGYSESGQLTEIHVEDSGESMYPYMNYGVWDPPYWNTQEDYINFYDGTNHIYQVTLEAAANLSCASNINDVVSSLMSTSVAATMYIANSAWSTYHYDFSTLNQSFVNLSECIVLGCTSNWANNFNENANTNDSTCFRLGCTSVWADNYDDLATTNDESCTRLGCTSNWADNYDDLATTNDESCTRLGCTSVWADNYDELATTNDESCYKIGCTQPVACNYDSLATIDIGCGNILSINSSQPEYYCSDYSWSLLSAENQILYSGGCGDSFDVCLSEGNYSLNSFNSSPSEWWPSWTYVLINDMDSVTTFNDSGSFTDSTLSLNFTLEFGCIDNEAKNYNPLATFDDGSCFYGSCTDSLACNYDVTASIDDGSCIYKTNNCQVCEYVHNHYTIIENDDDLDGICNGDDISGCTDSLACNFNNNANQDDGSCLITNSCTSCEQAMTLNNDTDGDGICNDNEVDGCNDPEACNYNSLATENDQSCIFKLEGYDCNNNCSTGIQLTFGGGTYLNEASFNILDCNLDTLAYSDGESFQTCINLPENYTLYLNDSFGDGWNGNSLVIGDSTYNLFNGYADTIDYGCIFYGCTDLLACNYDTIATMNDFSCTYPEPNLNCNGTCLDIEGVNGICDAEEPVGCLDPLSCNYIYYTTIDSATINDQSLCTFPEDNFDCEGNCEGGVVYTLHMYDSYGDGWNGNTLIFNDDVEYTFNDGFADSVDICVDTTTCYSIAFSADWYPTEVSWSITDPDNNYITDEQGDTLQNQGVYFSASAGISFQGQVYYGAFGNCNIVYGCSDQLALNYNPLANKDDGSCIYTILGCTDLTAFNYNIDANEDDESCEFTGCTVQFAFNYDSLATIEDGSCIASVYGCTDSLDPNFNPDANINTEEDCNTSSCQFTQVVVSLSDSYGDGWNGNILSIGSYALTLEHNSETFTTFFRADTICVDMDYCNTITVNDGTWSSEISWSIKTMDQDSIIISGGAPFIGTFGNCVYDDNNVAIINGCIDAIASNYDPYANSTGNCIYLSNWDPVEEYGCDNPLAINYNPGASSINNENCIYYGCMDTLAVNFSLLATVDDGSCSTNVCGSGFVLDCDGSEDCHPIYWIGDNFGDCEDQEYGADLTCYQNDGGDCGEIVVDIFGCTVAGSANYNPLATINNGTCEDGIGGCTDSLACNYEVSASFDDNSCVYPLGGMDCNEVNSYEITQFALLSNTNYVLKEGLCDLENYFLVADDYYVTGVNYGDISTQDGKYFEFEHVSGINDTSIVFFGDTVYMKINDLYVSSHLNIVSLTTNINKAIKVVITPRVNTYLGFQLTNFDKFNIVGLFDGSSTHKYLQRRLFDSLYSWTDVYNFGSFRISNYFDYSEITCGCTNSIALNYDSLATESDNSCAIIGCMDPSNDLFNPIANVLGSCDYSIEGCVYNWAFNYDPTATVDNGSCITFEYGCIDTLYLDYDSLANTDDGSCTNLIVDGCTDSLYLEYWVYYSTLMTVNLPNVIANTNDGSCSNLIITGCTDFNYLEYNDNANVVDNSLCETAKELGCTDSNYIEFNYLANTEDNTCVILKIFGCTNSLYLEFDTVYNTDTNPSSCIDLIVTGCMDDGYTEFDITHNLSDTSNCITPKVYGCINPMFVNFNSLANTDDGSCVTYLVVGCGNPAALNYTLGVTNNDNSLCVFEETYGCTDIMSFNYNPLADLDDETCYAVILGCMYNLAFNFDSLANTDNESCILVYTGCLDSTMFNYNADVNTDDGSCYPIVEGCIDSTMLNYDPLANTDIDSCIPIIEGCTDYIMLNYDSLANVDDNSCIPIVYGCVNALYIEYISEANVDDSSCSTLIVVGCTDSLYIEYTAIANTNDGTCIILIVNGCRDQLYLEFNNAANVDDGTCNELIHEGCTNELMYNYDELANIDDDSCYMLIEGCSDPSYFEYDSLVNSDNGTCNQLIILGCMDDGFIEYNIEANLEDNSCSDIVIPGCTNSLYMEFNDLANINNGSCQVLVILGCMDASMYNYYESANTDDGSCFSLSSFNLNPLDYQFNMSITAQIESTSGVFSTNLNDSIILISTVTNEISGFATLELVPFGINNYYAFITAYSNNLSDNLIVYVASSAIEAGFQIVDTLEFIPNSMLGSISTPWIFSLINYDENYGCTNASAVNYNSNAIINDGTCIIPGCINSDYVEFDFEANLDDGSCSLTWQDAYESLSNTISENNDVSNQLLIDSLQIQLDSLLINSNSIQTSLVDFFIEFPEGWSLFGFNCYESIDVGLAFVEISDKVILVKDEFGASFLPEYNFNGIGNLNYSEGYQIKLSEVVTGFQFCKILISEEE
jgi:hypothetical protein